MHKGHALVVCSVLAYGSAFGGNPLEPVDFTPNPGDIRMYRYVPTDVPDNAPLVVVLHGCTQTAASYARETGFNDLADKHKFYVVYAEQSRKNNPLACFNWFDPEDGTRDRGEAASIAQMVQKMKNDYSIDARKVYVTGVSAGGCMTANMAAAYPDLFAGAAVMAGIPYGCASSTLEGMTCMFLAKDQSPQRWGNLVRDASPREAQESYPIVSIFHGSADDKVPPKYATELMEQWTTVHLADMEPDLEEHFRGHPHRVYQDDNGKPVVEIYILEGMGHGISVDPGTGEDEGGEEGDYAFNEGVWSSYYAAKFWGLVGGAPE
jgi:poly(hydroxyalkanoate) depolymerase family esterase